MARGTSGVELVLHKGKLLPVLRGFPWSRYRVEWVILFGSLARKGQGRDIDLLVSGVSAENKLQLVLSIADHVGLDPDKVDIVEAQDASCPVIIDAWKHGVLVYEREPGAAREWLLRKTMICHDYSIMARKLNVVETAIRAARRRWG